MDKRTNRIIDDFVSSVATINSNLSKVYVFGSYASRTDRPNSDIDLAFVFRDLKDEAKFDLQVQLMLLASDFDMRIEPHPISNSDFNSGNPFAVEIKETGIEIETQMLN